MRDATRIFFGWYVVSCSFLISSVAVFAGIYLLAVVQTPMAYALGVPTAGLLTVVTMRTFVGLIVSPVAGLLADRPGASFPLLLLGGTIGGGAIFCTSFATELWHVYALQIVSTIVLQPGQILSTTFVTRWFRRRRGMALAIASTGTSAGSIILIPFASILVESADWRSAWRLAGVLVASVLIPSAFVFRKPDPASHGLAPDGESTSSGTGNASSPEEHWPATDAIRSTSFWLLTTISSVINLAAVGFIFTVPTLAADRGLSGLLLGLALSAFPAGIVASRPIWGYMSQRVSYATTYYTTLFGLGACFVALVYAGDPAAFVALTFCVGLLQGANVPIYNLMLAEYFGTRSLGMIIGLTRPVSSGVLALGPVTPSLIAQSSGSYAPWLVASAVSFALCAPLVGRVHKPRRLTPIARAH